MPAITREKILEEQKGMIIEKVKGLCVIDEAQKIALLHYVLTFVNDDQAADIREAAITLVNS